MIILLSKYQWVIHQVSFRPTCWQEQRMTTTQPQRKNSQHPKGGITPEIISIMYFVVCYQEKTDVWVHQTSVNGWWNICTCNIWNHKLNGWRFHVWINKTMTFTSNLLGIRGRMVCTKIYLWNIGKKKRMTRTILSPYKSILLADDGYRQNYISSAQLNSIKDPKQKRSNIPFV